MASFGSNKFTKFHRSVNKESVILDTKESIRLILTTMSDKNDLYDFTMIQDGFKVLNTLAHMYQFKDRMPTDKWDDYMHELTNVIAAENTLDWVGSYNRYSQGYSSKYGRDASTLKFSCYLKQCSKKDIDEAFGYSEEQLNKKRLQKKRWFHDNYVASLGEYGMDGMDGVEYMKEYRRSIGDEGDHIKGGMWNLVVPTQITSLSIKCNIYRIDENYSDINLAFREHQAKLHPGITRNILDLAGALLFPAYLKQDLTVFRIDHQRTTERTFKTTGFYSTTLSYDVAKGFDKTETRARKNDIVRILKITIPKGTPFLPLFKCYPTEREITLIPGSTLKRSDHCDEGNLSYGGKYKICEYTVINTVELSDQVQQRIFDRLHAEKSKHEENYHLLSFREEKKLVEDIVNAYE